MTDPSGQILHQDLRRNKDKPKKNVKITTLRSPKIHGTVKIVEVSVKPIM